MENGNGYINHDFFDSELEEEFYSFSPTLDDLSSFSSDEDEEDDFYYASGDGELSYDDIFSDLDFSEYSGNYKSNMRRAVSKIKNNPAPFSRKRKPVLKKPLTNRVGIKKSGNIKAVKKGIGKIIVPDDRKVIVQGVNSFILDQSAKSDYVKNIGYHKNKKLRELVITFNNDSAIDFELELFNPSMPMDYLQSTSLNLNDKVTIAGGIVSYTDILYYLLANPTRIYASKFTSAGASQVSQVNQPLIVKNKSISGEQKVEPFQMGLNIDIDQQQNQIIYFDLEQTLNRPFIPDGMDIIQYKVLAGMTVTFGFYYSQVSLKKFFYPEAAQSKGLM